MVSDVQKEQPDQETLTSERNKKKRPTEVRLTAMQHQHTEITARLLARKYTLRQARWKCL